MATTKNPAVLCNTAQELSDTEKAQALANIGLPDPGQAEPGQVLTVQDDGTAAYDDPSLSEITDGTSPGTILNGNTPVDCDIVHQKSNLADWDTLIDTGLYSVNTQANNVQNSPESGMMPCVVIGNDPSHTRICQMAFGNNMHWRWLADNGNPGDDWTEWFTAAQEYTKARYGKWIGLGNPFTTTLVDSTELKYWRLCSFDLKKDWWCLQFEVDVGNCMYDNQMYETKLIHICGNNTGTNIAYAREVREFHDQLRSDRGYGNIIYYTTETNSSETYHVTIYIKSRRDNNFTQFCRLNKVVTQRSIVNLTWYTETEDLNPQPSNPIKFTEVIDGHYGSYRGTYGVTDINPLLSNRTIRFNPGDWFTATTGGTIGYYPNNDNNNSMQYLSVYANDDVYWTPDGTLAIKPTSGNVFEAYCFPSGTSTSFSSIENALNAGKTVILNYQATDWGNGRIYTMLYTGRYLSSGETTTFEFFCLDERYEISIKCNSSTGWGALTYTLRDKIEADTVDGYHIVVGELGNAANTIYIF